ncbi:MAG: hypothetical protein LBW85_08530 [Deltaproteobacteria bacterium]|jgi:hypothetical protein|nr:hypothetical protein [Deltaproteobacteria bacterium]
MSILGGSILGLGGGGGGGGGIPEAPSDGKTYGRLNASWAPVESARYRHLQAAASDLWNVQHNLGSRPVALWTFDSAGERIYGEPDYASATLNLLQVRFSRPVSGSAFVQTLI